MAGRDPTWPIRDDESGEPVVRLVTVAQVAALIAEYRRADALAVMLRTVLHRHGLTEQAVTVVAGVNDAGTAVVRLACTPRAARRLASLVGGAPPTGGG